MGSLSIMSRPGLHRLSPKLGVVNANFQTAGKKNCIIIITVEVEYKRTTNFKNAKSST